MLLAQLNVTKRSSRTTALIANLLTFLLQPLVLAIGLCFARCYAEHEQHCVREATTTLLTCAYTPFLSLQYMYARMPPATTQLHTMSHRLDMRGKVSACRSLSLPACWKERVTMARLRTVFCTIT